MYMNNQVDIKFITVTPKRPTICHFYINDSTKANVRSYSKLKTWLNELTHNALYSKLSDLFKEYASFIVDIENLEIIRLEIDNSNQQEIIKQILFPIDINSIELEKEKESLDNKLKELSETQF